MLLLPPARALMRLGLSLAVLAPAALCALPASASAAEAAPSPSVLAAADARLEISADGARLTAEGANDAKDNAAGEKGAGGARSGEAARGGVTAIWASDAADIGLRLSPGEQGLERADQPFSLTVADARSAAISLDPPPSPTPPPSQHPTPLPSPHPTPAAGPPTFTAADLRIETKDPQASASTLIALPELRTVDVDHPIDARITASIPDTPDDEDRGDEESGDDEGTDGSEGTDDGGELPVPRPAAARQVPHLVCAALQIRSVDEIPGAMPEVSVAAASLPIVIAADEHTAERVIAAAQCPQPEAAEPPAQAERRLLDAAGFDGQARQAGQLRTGPGVDLTGVDAPAAQLGFALAAGPADAAVTYRSSSAEGFSLARGYSVRTFDAAAPAVPVIRAVPSRDAFAAWSFSRPGVYCLAVGARGFDPASEQIAAETRTVPAADLVRVAVADEHGRTPEGPANCRQAGDQQLAFPALSARGKDTDGDEGEGDGRDQEDRSTGIGPEEDSAHGIGGDADDRLGVGGIRAPQKDPQDGRAGDAARTRVITAPPNALGCPSGATGPRQVSSGQLRLIPRLDGGQMRAGLRLTQGRASTDIGQEATLVVPADARRELRTPVAGFGKTGAAFWATSTSSKQTALSFGWDAGELPADAELDIIAADGPGAVAIMADPTKTPAVMADSEHSTTLETGSTQTTALVFGAVGEYTLTLGLRPADAAQAEPESTVTLTALIGDTSTGRTDSPLLRALTGTCPGFSLSTALADPLPVPEAPAQPQPQAQPETQAAALTTETARVLAAGLIVIAGMLAGIAAIAYVRDRRS